MSMTANRDTPPHRSKDKAACRGRDARKDAQENEADEEPNNPPNHRLPTHGVGQFLWNCPPDTPVSELGELYRRWKDDTEQATFNEWRADDE